MRTHRWTFGWFAIAGLVCSAQTRPHNATDWATAALNHESLIVWRVMNTNRPEPHPYLGYSERTASTLGSSAGSVGQAASDAGTAAGSFGSNASSTGQTSSTYGQSAGDFAQPAGNTGQTAGSYGKAPSDLGPSPGSVSKSAGDYGKVSGDSGYSLSTINGSAGKNVNQRRSAPARDLVMDQLTPVETTFRGLQASFVTVYANELKDKLDATAGTRDYPDVLVGEPLPNEWTQSGLMRETVLATLGSQGVAEPNDFGLLSRKELLQSSVLLRAQHPDAARAFVVWLHDGPKPLVLADKPEPLLADAISLAIATAHSVLEGSQVAEADPEMADFFGPRASYAALEPAFQAAWDGLQIRLDAVDASANARLAVVAMRGVVSSPHGFGVVYPLAVLRRVGEGAWKVLQITANLAPPLQSTTYDMLASLAYYVPPENLKEIAGISQAAPADGDNRTQEPDLWWDNGGSARLQVVEWQMGSANQWSESHLDLVSDTNPRLQTRVTAHFAYHQGGFRWRVWSVGRGGVLKISPWRRLNIV